MQQNVNENNIIDNNYELRTFFEESTILTQNDKISTFRQINILNNRKLNVGNSCYFYSMLQSISQFPFITDLVKKYAEDRDNKNIQSDESKLILEYAKLLESNNDNDIKTSFRTMYQLFQQTWYITKNQANNAQQSSAEAFRHFIKILNKNLELPVEDLFFKFYSETTMTYDNVPNNNPKKIYKTLSVEEEIPLRNDGNIETNLEGSVKKAFSSEENCFDVDNPVGGKTSAKKKQEPFTTPTVLCLSYNPLIEMNQDNLLNKYYKRYKLQNSIKFNNEEYILMSRMLHGAGHYRCQCRNFNNNNNYTLFDDGEPKGNENPDGIVPNFMLYIKKEDFNKIKNGNYTYKNFYEDKLSSYNKKICHTEAYYGANGTVEKDLYFFNLKELYKYHLNLERKKNNNLQFIKNNNVVSQNNTNINHNNTNPQVIDLNIANTNATQPQSPVVDQLEQDFKQINDLKITKNFSTDKITYRNNEIVEITKKRGGFFSFGSKNFIFKPKTTNTEITDEEFIIKKQKNKILIKDKDDENNILGYINNKNEIFVKQNSQLHIFLNKIVYEYNFKKNPQVKQDDKIINDELDKLAQSQSNPDIQQLINNMTNGLRNTNAGESKKEGDDVSQSLHAPRNTLETFFAPPRVEVYKLVKDENENIVQIPVTPPPPNVPQPAQNRATPSPQIHNPVQDDILLDGENDNDNKKKKYQQTYNKTPQAPSPQNYKNNLNNRLNELNNAINNKKNNKSHIRDDKQHVIIRNNNDNYHTVFGKINNKKNSEKDNNKIKTINNNTLNSINFTPFDSSKKELSQTNISNSSNQNIDNKDDNRNIDNSNPNNQQQNDQWRWYNYLIYIILCILIITIFLAEEYKRRVDNKIANNKKNNNTSPLINMDSYSQNKGNILR